MRSWTYVEPTSATDLTPVTVTMTEQEILDTYFEHWCEQMRAAGLETEGREAECVDDWVVVHWASPVERPDPPKVNKGVGAGPYPERRAVRKYQNAAGEWMVELECGHSMRTSRSRRTRRCRSCATG